MPSDIAAVDADADSRCSTYVRATIVKSLFDLNLDFFFL